MKEQLKQLREKVKRSQQDVTDTAAQQIKKEDIEEERQKVLRTGKSFIRPLTMNPKRALKITGLIIAGLAIGILALFAVLIYRYQSDSKLVYEASQIIPFPAARVNGEFVGYDDYLFELRSLKQYAQHPIGGSSGIDFSTPEGKQQLATFKSVAMAEAQRKIIVANMAAEAGVQVTEEELQKTIDQYIKNEGGRQQLEEAIDYFYGWDFEDFKEVIHIQLLQKQLVRQRAESVLEKARSGADFAELARQYSSDTSKAEGGNLGFVTEETPFVENFKQAALQLEPGEVSGLVETRFGFHIIKATDKDPEKGVKVSHILIDPSRLQQRVEKRLQNAEKTSYIGVSADPQQTQQQPAPEAS